MPPGIPPGRSPAARTREGLLGLRGTDPRQQDGEERLEQVGKVQRALADEVAADVEGQGIDAVLAKVADAIPDASDVRALYQLIRRLLRARREG